MSDVQTADNNDDVNKKEVDSNQERAEGDVDGDEQEENLRDHASEDEQLAKARSQELNDHHDNVGAVGVRGRHRALAVPWAREEARQAHRRRGDMRNDIVAGSLDGRQRNLVVGDDCVCRGRIKY